MGDAASRLAVHFSSAKDDWETPPEIFDPLNAEFGFTLDAAASPYNAKCPYSFEEGALEKSWDAPVGGAVWLNPPYGRNVTGKWVAKAFEESQERTVVCLLPARTDTKFFHDYVARGEIRFIKGRVKFITRLPDGSRVQLDAAPFPSMVVIFRPQDHFSNPGKPIVQLWHPWRPIVRLWHP